MAVLAAVASCFGVAVAAQAKSAPLPKDITSQDGASQVRIDGVEIGFGTRPRRTAQPASAGTSATGLYKVGMWAPVNVTLTGGTESQLTGTLEIEFQDGDGLHSLVSKQVTVPAGATARHQLMIRPGAQGGLITVRVRGEDSGTAPIAETTAPLSAMLSSQTLWVELGADFRTSDAARTHELDDTEAIEIARVNELGTLPTRWIGYESVDVLFVSVDHPDLRSQLANNSRLEALDTWVQAGGRLVLCVGGASGDESEFFSTVSPHPLARFSPGPFRANHSRVFELSEFQDPPFETTHRLEVETAIDVPHLASLPRGRTRFPLLNGTPAIVDVPHGLGQVTFFAFDLHKPPFLNWGGRARLINWLADWPMDGVRQDDKSERGQLTHSGITDIAAQLRAGLDQYPEVTIVPFWAIAMAILGYVALVGPIDYFLVKKGFFFRRRDGVPRMEFTWLSLPLWVVLVSIAAYWLAARSKGDNLFVNQLQIVDYDLDSGTVRGSAWFSVFSPSMEAYHLSVDAGGANGDRNMALGWLGIPGPVLGGMSTQAQTLAQQSAPYRYEDDYARIREAPIPVWSSRSYTARWLIRSEPTVAISQDANSPAANATPEFLPPLMINVTAREGEPRGAIQNASGHDLISCVFVFDQRAYLIGRLEDGQTVNVASLSERNLRGELTNQRLVVDEKDDKFRNVSDAYDILNRDLPTIARQMSFFEESGGSDYAKVVNRYQSFVDLSPQVELGRGVFFGFVEDAAPSVVITGQSELSPKFSAWTCLRLVCDVPSDDQ